MVSVGLSPSFPRSSGPTLPTCPCPVPSCSRSHRLRSFGSTSPAHRLRVFLLVISPCWRLTPCSAVGVSFWLRPLVCFQCWLEVCLCLQTHLPPLPPTPPLRLLHQNEQPGLFQSGEIQVSCWRRPSPHPPHPVHPHLSALLAGHAQIHAFLSLPHRRSSLPRPHLHPSYRSRGSEHKLLSFLVIRIFTAVSKLCCDGGPRKVGPLSVCFPSVPQTSASTGVRQTFGK